MSARWVRCRTQARPGSGRFEIAFWRHRRVVDGRGGTSPRSWSPRTTSPVRTSSGAWMSLGMGCAIEIIVATPRHHAWTSLGDRRGGDGHAVPDASPDG